MHIFLQQCCGAAPPGRMLSFNTLRQAPSMPDERFGTHVARDLKAQAQASFDACSNYPGTTVIKPWPAARSLHDVMPVV